MTHDIWNPWHGCHKCSAGCANCYMYALDAQRGVESSSNEVRLTKALKYPLSKTRDGSYKLKPGERIQNDRKELKVICRKIGAMAGRM